MPTLQQRAPVSPSSLLDRCGSLRWWQQNHPCPFRRQCQLGAPKLASSPSTRTSQPPPPERPGAAAPEGSSAEIQADRFPPHEPRHPCATRAQSCLPHQQASDTIPAAEASEPDGTAPDGSPRRTECRAPPCLSYSYGTPTPQAFRLLWPRPSLRSAQRV